MEIIRAGEILLRSSTPVASSIFRPSLIRPAHCVSTASIAGTPWQRSAIVAGRTFTTTRTLPDEATASGPAARRTAPERIQQNKSSISHQIDDLLSPQRSSGPSTTKSSHNPFTYLNASKSTSTSADLASSAYLSSLNKSSPTPFGSSFSPSTGRSGLDVDMLRSPIAPTGMYDDLAYNPPPIVPRPQLKFPDLNSSTGRTVTLKPGVDLAKGLRQLDLLVARNRVRADFNKQRFHERPGLKRKRLKSERWRRRFRAGFKDIVGRVVHMTKKGW